MIPEKKIIDYLEGQLLEPERSEMEIALQNSSALREEVEVYRSLLKSVDQLPEHQPSSKLENNFYTFLKEEQAKELVVPFWKKHKTAFSIAAGIALFIIGLWVGNQMNDHQVEQISQIEKNLQITQSLMLQMLKKESASQRIKAVNYSYDFETSDEAVIDALIRTMNFDQNMNVRLHAAEALARFGTKEKVRDAFLIVLANPDHPEIQIKAINILVHLKEQRAVGGMLKLLEQDSTIDAVKQQVQSGLEILL